MKKIVVYAVLFAILSGAAGAEAGPMVLEAGAHAQTVFLGTFTVVPCLDALFLPLAIKADEGLWNWMGLDLRLGFPVSQLPGGGLSFRMWGEAQFVGRFGVIPKIPIDLTAGFGWRPASTVSTFYGVTGLRVGWLFVDRLMAKLGILARLWPNPDYADDIYNNPPLLWALGLSLGLDWRFLGPAD